MDTFSDPLKKLGLKNIEIPKVGIEFSIAINHD